MPSFMAKRRRRKRDRQPAAAAVPAAPPPAPESPLRRLLRRTSSLGSSLGLSKRRTRDSHPDTDASPAAALARSPGSSTRGDARATDQGLPVTPQRKRISSASFTQSPLTPLTPSPAPIGPTLLPLSTGEPAQRTSSLGDTTGSPTSIPSAAATGNHRRTSSDLSRTGKSNNNRQSASFHSLAETRPSSVAQVETIATSRRREETGGTTVRTKNLHAESLDLDRSPEANRAGQQRHELTPLGAALDSLSKDVGAPSSPLSAPTPAPETEPKLESEHELEHEVEHEHETEAEPSRSYLRVQDDQSLRAASSPANNNKDDDDDKRLTATKESSSTMSAVDTQSGPTAADQDVVAQSEKDLTAEPGKSTNSTRRERARERVSSPEIVAERQQGAPSTEVSFPAAAAERAPITLGAVEPAHTPTPSHGRPATPPLLFGTPRAARTVDGEEEEEGPSSSSRAKASGQAPSTAPAGLHIHRSTLDKAPSSSLGLDDPFVGTSVPLEPAGNDSYALAAAADAQTSFPRSPVPPPSSDSEPLERHADGDGDVAQTDGSSSPVRRHDSRDLHGRADDLYEQDVRSATVEERGMGIRRCLVEAKGALGRGAETKEQVLDSPLLLRSQQVQRRVEEQPHRPLVLRDEEPVKSSIALDFSPAEQAAHLVVGPSSRRASVPFTTAAPRAQHEEENDDAPLSVSEPDEQPSLHEAGTTEMPARNLLTYGDNILSRAGALDPETLHPVREMRDVPERLDESKTVGGGLVQAGKPITFSPSKARAISPTLDDSEERTTATTTTLVPASRPLNNNNQPPLLPFLPRLFAPKLTLEFKWADRRLLPSDITLEMTPTTAPSQYTTRTDTVAALQQQQLRGRRISMYDTARNVSAYGASYVPQNRLMSWVFGRERAK
ncbi:hypothetical protein QFC19_002871 [Naganishia cerealis]|uniref:Uncharacterized protein n=1 Tax=Naganishia cerealis TaxID=610337 RepID=A0ACC2W5J9_9TREE|nr:hypothetical protein QFC19_002871 [Naganishia cerealis]